MCQSLENKIFQSQQKKNSPLFTDIASNCSILLLLILNVAHQNLTSHSSCASRKAGIYFTCNASLLTASPQRLWPNPLSRPNFGDLREVTAAIFEAIADTNSVECVQTRVRSLLSSGGVRYLWLNILLGSGVPFFKVTEIWEVLQIKRNCLKTTCLHPKTSNTQITTAFRDISFEIVCQRLGITKVEHRQPWIPTIASAKSL